MPTNTPKFNLIKPLKSENYNVDQFNTNADTIDSQIYSKSEVDTITNLLLNSRVVGNTNKKYKIVACALRCIAGEWSIIQDANHVPLGVSSVTSTGSSITLNFDFTAKAVGTLVVVPDETYVTKGINFGASVGLSSAVIVPSINREIGGLISFDGTNWGTFFAPGVTSAVWSTNKLVVTHEESIQSSPHVFKVSATPRGGNLVVSLGSLGVNTIDIQWHDYNGAVITTPNTNMAVYVNRHISGPVNMAQMGLTNSNLWCFGIFEIE